jgi:hypothetical protein
MTETNQFNGKSYTGKTGFGMLDIVKYNNEAFIKEKILVEEHFDPGLLSFNVLSTCSGLELYVYQIIHGSAHLWIKE